MGAASGGWSAGTEELDREMAVTEFFMLGLRLAGGVRVRDVEERFAMSLKDAAPRLDRLAKRGLVSRYRGRIRLTPAGLPFADTVIAGLF